MNNLDRLQELESYKLNYQTKEQAFEDIVQIASTICNSEVAVITFLDDRRQFFKATYGLPIKEAPLASSFCQYTINAPNDILIVEDTLKHFFFKNHPQVINAPFLRSYIGVPLVSPNGFVLGTLSISDSKPLSINEKQISALKLLANRVMDFLNHKKELMIKENKIQHEAKRLKHLADMAPSILYQFERDADGRMYYSFLSKSFQELFPQADMEQLFTDATGAFNTIHPDDIEELVQSLEVSYQNSLNWNYIFRVIPHDKKTVWIAAQSTIEKREDGSATWYGSYQNITNIKLYEEILEQISFDISHVLRKPISTLMGLTSLINEEKHSIDTILDYSKHINTVSTELDEFTHKLNEAYQLKKELFINSKII